MNTHLPNPAQVLIRQTALCIWLGKTRSGLDKLRKTDPTFPKPIKDRNTRQAAAYFLVSEVEAWLAVKVAQRDARIGGDACHISKSTMSRV